MGRPSAPATSGRNRVAGAGAPALVLLVSSDQVDLPGAACCWPSEATTCCSTASLTPEQAGGLGGSLEFRCAIGPRLRTHPATPPGKLRPPRSWAATQPRPPRMNAIDRHHAVVL